MKVFVPSSITPNALLTIGGRDLQIGTFHSVNKDNKPVQAEYLYLMANDTVINSLKLSTDVVNTINTLNDATKGTKGEAALDKAKDDIADGALGQFFTRFKAVKGKSIEESWVNYLPTVSGFVTANFSGKVKDSLGLSKKATKNAIIHLVGKRTTGITVKELQGAVISQITEEMVASIMGMPRNLQGYIVMKQTLVKDPNAVTKKVVINVNPMTLITQKPAAPAAKPAPAKKTK